jgi:hypothetical protein
MNHDPNDVVKVYSGTLETVEIYQQVLKEAGIESHVVGGALTSVFGSAIPDTVELLVHRRDGEKAAATIQNYEHPKKRQNHERHAHPTDSPKPGGAPKHKEPYVNPDPSAE